MKPLHNRIFPAIAAAMFCVGGYSQQPPKPETPEQIGIWVVEDVWNKGDFRLASRLLKPTVILHYRGQAFPLNPNPPRRPFKPGAVHSPTSTSHSKT
jgi:hypothetical protein